MFYKSVILVDYDPDDRDIFCISVKEISHEVECKQFSKVSDASSYLESAEVLPDIIFAEIDTHLINSINFIQQIKRTQKFKNIPVYIYSTPLMIKELGAAVDEEVTGYLYKTANFNDFERDLRKILERKS